MKIGDFETDKEVLVIAEIGNNHEGSPGLAEEMIGLAAEAGAGAVKFQTIVPERLVGPRDEARLEQLRGFSLSWKDYERLAGTAESEGIMFLSTPFDLESAEFLNPLVPAFKISSGDITFYPLIEKVADFGKPVILSTGAADLTQIGYAKALIRKIWSGKGAAGDLAILHCVCAYPVPPDQANLSGITLLKSKFKCTIGYSDHTLGIEAAVLSAALGARIVEKHFTIDKKRSGFRDHRLSADPGDLARLIERVKEVNTLMGLGEKVPQPCEADNAIAARRSVALGRDMAKGEPVSWKDLSWLRPGGGVMPGREALFLGRRLKKDVSAGTFLEEDLFE